jgi:hypothetical protein
MMTNADARSLQETHAHIREVQRRLIVLTDNIYRRASVHDASKLVDPELSGYADLHMRLAGVSYGTEAYRAALREARATVEHHYASNDHHPEHYTNHPDRHARLDGEEIVQLRLDIIALRTMPASSEMIAPLNRLIQRLERDLAEAESPMHHMSLLSVTEMLADWAAEGMRTRGGSLAQSIAVNRARFGSSELLSNIFENTRRELGWE